MKGVIALALAAAASASPVVVNVGSRDTGAAPLLSATNAEGIPNSYIIKFKDHVTEDHAAAHHGWVSENPE